MNSHRYALRFPQKKAFRYKKRTGFKSGRKMSGQSFKLKQKLPSELVRASLTYVVPFTGASGGAPARISIGPDGVLTNAAGTATFTTYDSIVGTTAKFNAFQALYDLYMVTFVKAKFVPVGVYPTTTALSNQPVYSSHLSGFNDWSVTGGTPNTLSNQDKLWQVRFGEEFSRSISMAYHAQNTLPQPFLPVSSYATGGYAGLTGGLVGAVTDLKTPAIGYYCVCASSTGVEVLGYFKVTVYYAFKDRKV